jgi:flagellar hook assembly protein FlgD
MLIRIMTVSGAVVREIRADELGPLRIGTNRTEFWWDGTDMFGDRLANGIYLYTVQARLRGQDMDLNSTDAAGFFTKGVGKMYLLR